MDLVLVAGEELLVDALELDEDPGTALPTAEMTTERVAHGG